MDCNLLCLIISVTLVAISIALCCEVYAQLQSFPRQEITEGIRDGIQINLTTNTQTKADYKGKLDNSTDIEKVTYFSDGKSLDATLWLGGSISKNLSVGGAEAGIYGVLIDVDDNPATGRFGVDYKKEIVWNDKTQKWNSFIIEYSSPHHARILEWQRNDSLSVEGSDQLPSFSLQEQEITEGQNYIPLSFGLESITSPEKYKVLYYAGLLYHTGLTYRNNSKFVVDFTSWLDIPPAAYTLSTLPSPLILQQGEKMDIGVKLESSSGVTPNAVDFNPSKNYSSIKVPSDPNRSANSSTFFGIAPTPFTIEVPKEAEVGQYTVPILVNISLGSLFPARSIELWDFNFSVPDQGYINKQANLSLSVTEPPTSAEQLAAFWDAYGSLVALMTAAFMGGLSSYFFEYLRSRKKRGAPIDKN